MGLQKKVFTMEGKYSELEDCKYTQKISQVKLLPDSTITRAKKRKERVKRRFYVVSPFLSPFSEKWLKFTGIVCLAVLLSVVDQAKSNPFPRQGRSSTGDGSHSENVKFVGEGRSSRNSVEAGESEKIHVQTSPASFIEQPLVKPSHITFNLSRFCEADVSLDRVVCQNVKKVGDLPKIENWFSKVQQALFINISVGEGGDIRLEHLQKLFPNLIVLGITYSAGTAASLINLQGTKTASRFEPGWSLAPKSLLQDPHFARRLNLNYFSLVQKPTVASLRKEERALTSSTTASTTSTAKSGEDSYEETNDIDAPLHDSPVIDSSEKNSPDEEINSRKKKADEMNAEEDAQSDAALPEPPQKLRMIVWPSVRHLNISWNQLTSDSIPDFLPNIFPNLEVLDMSNNFLANLDKIREADWPKLESIDVSGNPLDCTNLGWIESAKFRLLHPNFTICDKPPHQNKAKPIFSVLPLLKKVREECRVNCSCDVDYIWEQNHVVHSKTVVNCSGKGFLDFPDPSHLPRPTDTLDLSNNNITSMSTFVDDDRYLELNVMNLYLDNNQISSINDLERSDWFLHFQVFSIRRNDLTEVPVYVLENVLRQNKRLYQIDLSSNKFKCDCSTVSSFKVWLLRYSHQIGNVESVRCHSTKEQIRYMKMEEWCQMDNGTELLNILDLVSICLAFIIVAIIAKVYYDYWNFKTKGKLPWIVSKM